MRLDTVAIVGVGLIGGSIGMALRKRRLARRVVGVARRKATLDRARRMGALHSGTLDLARGVADAELTIFCTPVNLIADQAERAAAHCPPGALFTDAGSTKRHIVARLEASLPEAVRFVGSHPLAGSEKRGVDEARADLFVDRVSVVTVTDKTPRDAVAAVTAFWRALGARVLTMTPEMHDQALAYASHLPHLAAASLSIVLPQAYRELAASGFHDTTRIAASDPELWTAIFLDNARPLLESLRSYEAALSDFRVALEQGDDQRLRELWGRSKENREAVAEVNGSLRPPRPRRRSRARE